MRDLWILLLTLSLAAPRVHAADPLDAKYPQLATLKITADELPPSIKPVQLTHTPPHESLKAFVITEDKVNFGVNAMLFPVLLHDRINAFYMGTYDVRSREGGEFKFMVQAWQYQDEAAAKTNAAEFAGVTADTARQQVSTDAEVRHAIDSVRYLRDGNLVVSLIIDAKAPQATRLAFEMLVKSRLSEKHIEVPIAVPKMASKEKSLTGRTPPFDENSEEVQNALAAVRKKWKKDFSAAKSPKKKSSLAKKLVSEAQRSADKPLPQFAMLFTAVMLTAEAGDIDTAVTIAETLGKHFEYDIETGRIKLAAMACENRTQPLSAATQKMVLKMCDEAIDMEQWYSAKLLLKAAKLSPDHESQVATESLEKKILRLQPESQRDNNPGQDGPDIVRMEPEPMREVEREAGPAPKRNAKERPLPKPEAKPNPFVMANGETIALPAKFEDVIVGGSGRFLFFQIGELKKLLVFDVQQQELVHEIPLEEADSRIAAGADFLYIAVRRENVLQRWSLDGFEKELTVKLPFQSPVEDIATGSHATEVIYAGSADKHGTLLDPETLKPAKLRMIDHTGRRPADPLPGAEKTVVRASANGRTFCLLSTRYSPGDFRTLVVMNGFVHSFRRGESVSYMAPDFNGELIYTPKGVFTDQCTEFRLSDGLFAKRFQMPSVGSSYTISVDREDRKKKERATVNVHTGSAAEPMLSVSDLTLRPGDYSDFHAQSRLTLDRRVFFFPDEKLIVTLPQSNDMLVLNDLDVEEELEKTGDAFLFVVSRPPQYIKKGRRFEYQLDVKSDAGGIQYKMDSGPSGMRINDEGLVSWRAPRKGDAPFDAVITVSNEEARETTHAFRLTIID